MGLSFCLFTFMQLLLSLLSFHSTIADFSSSNKSLCHADERSALLQFKESLIINEKYPSSFYSNFDPCHPKSASWKPDEGNIDCCSWDGVICNEETGHVVDLDLSSSCLYGSINSSSSLFHLVHLQRLNLADNGLSGEIPISIRNLSSLEELDLSYNRFSGKLPSLIGNLSSLKSLRLLSNQFSGFSSCNLTEFPSFVQDQYQLGALDLSANKISGQIPKWILNLSIENLRLLNLSHNLLTGFDQQPVLLPWSSIPFTLDLSSNKLQGPLPVPHIAVYRYQVSNNKLTGKIPPWICNLDRLRVLDLSYNNLSGVLPHCLGNFSDELLILKLRNNNFFGSIPNTFMNGTNLKMIDLSDNNLQGRIPRSLASCINLEFLHLGNNQITDTFPLWLGTLPELKVLILQSNRFHGVIIEPETNCNFPKLRIIDLSENRFMGKLRSKYFQCWKAMTFVNSSQLAYIQLTLPIFASPVLLQDSMATYDYSLTISSKGKMMAYEKTPYFLTGIILSSNRFDGEIPASIANLMGLQILNLSNNNLQGHIPSCLGKLTNLESLDLSNNKFSGQIPLQLVELTFLGSFDVSHNHLTGAIPQGSQFDTFDNNSFEGNWGLCGKPLSKKCEIDSDATENEDSQDSVSLYAFDWKIILIGYIGGLLVGVVLGNNFGAGIQGWSVRKVGRQSKPMRRKRRQRH